MTPENRAKLLQAPCFAIQAEQDGISDLLQDVILGEMDASYEVPIRIHGIGDDTTIMPPWNVTCEPLGAKGTWVGIDPLTHMNTTTKVDE